MYNINNIKSYLNFEIMNNVREINICEVCKNKDLVSVLDLGKLPLCDDLIPIDSSKICIEYPTEVLFCKKCATAHQRFQVNKRNLFPDTYHYRARFTIDVLNGMEDLVKNCINNYGEINNKKVLDIGCNDGSLLNFFRKKGAKTFGIEPTGAALEAREQGHSIINSFFDLKTSLDFVSKYGKPDFITFTNVFAHIEDLDSLLTSVKQLMHEDTVLVIENHYLGSILKTNQFDTFYHEHPRSYSYSSFLKIAKSLNLKITELQFPERYGGNIRIFLDKIKSKKNIDLEFSNELIEKEKNFEKLFFQMSNNIDIWKKSKLNEIENLKNNNNKILAKAFPGRAAILIRLLELDENTIYAVYEKNGSKKIGNYIPGTRIPILSDDELFKSNLSLPILNLAWHIPEEIRDYLKKNKVNTSVVDIINQNDFI